MSIRQLETYILNPEPGDFLGVRKPSTRTKSDMGRQRRGSSTTLHEETHCYGCCARCYSRRGLAHGSWCGGQPRFVIDIAMERDHVGIVPSGRSHPDGLVACPYTQRRSLLWDRGVNPILSQVHSPVREMSHPLLQ